MTAKTVDALVPDPQVWAEFGVTRGTLHRWDRDEELGFPVALQINGRNFRRRSELEEFKARLLKKAIARRKARRR